MIFYFNPRQNSLAELLEAVSSRTGFTPSEVGALIDCELETEYLLEYITAVVSKRMN